MFANFRRWIVASLLVAALAVSAAAKDVTLSIPKRTKPTPVQKLNQDGVRAVEKHDYKKAKSLFYKAYLIDPNDPFTLNNWATSLSLKARSIGRSVTTLLRRPEFRRVVYKSTEHARWASQTNRAGNAADSQMQINRMNVAAMGLLQKDRAPEADLALQKALELDPNNPFTLNNLGYAREKEGELEDAYVLHAGRQPAFRHADCGDRASVVAR